MRPTLRHFWIVALGAALNYCGAQDPVIDEMEAPSFKFGAKGTVEVVGGHAGKALNFSFPPESKSVFAMRPARATAEWDQAAGFSFWVKGNGGPQKFGCLQFIWGEDYALRYDYAFPIENTEWRKITVPWRDLIPVLPGPNARPIDPASGNAPSKLSQLWFGKWWYWREPGGESFAVDDIRLEKAIERDPRNDTPVEPLARVRAKLKEGKAVTIVTMGDSLTDTKHWTNRTTNWPAMLQTKLKERFGATARVDNPAIGGTQLRQNIVLIPLWVQTAPEPDLVTVCFGYNDWDAGMRGPMFLETQRDAVSRIRRATHGKADVLLMTPARALTRWTEMAELGEATRSAARETVAGLADLEQAFETAGGTDRARLFAEDKVHLSPAGQDVVANAVLNALSGVAK